jgi:protein-S-isoprenylcysteine O-methyltransferase
MNLPEELGLTYLVSEIGLAVFKRAKRRSARSADRGTLGLIWISIVVGSALAMIVPRWLPSDDFALGRAGRTAMLVLFAGGIALRWWAIVTLGRFFTVDVAIHDDHELVRRGPFAFVRHPSYTGALLALLALSLTFENVASVVCLLVPVTAAVVYRIRVEEQALAGAFGKRWSAYCASAKRLIPGVY